jgi:aminoglycoside N3'-acetyltransferase
LAFLMVIKSMNKSTQICRYVNNGLANFRICRALIQKAIRKIAVKTESNTAQAESYSFTSQDELEQFLDSKVFLQNDKFCLHISTKRLSCKNFDAELFINYLKRKCANGILLIPAFTMESTQHSALLSKNISHETSKISTGIISKLAASDPDFRLILHPTHSYLMLQTKLRYNHDFDSYNGLTTDKSPLKFLEQNSGSILNLGVGLNQTTFIHCIEEEDIAFPFQTLTKVIEGHCSSRETSSKRKFAIRPLKPLLYHIRDCDVVKQKLISLGCLCEYHHKTAVIQTIRMDQMRLQLRILAKKGYTIYGDYRC